MGLNENPSYNSKAKHTSATLLFNNKCKTSRVITEERLKK